MPITDSSVKRATDSTGDDIKTFQDGDGKHIQAAALVDGNGAQVVLQTDALTNDELRASPIPISASALPLPTGAATAANQTTIIAALAQFAYGVNDVDEASATVTYVGKSDKDGNWLVQKISVSGVVTTLTYATVLNNASVLTYSAAWTARATLTYGTFAQAF